MCPCDLEFQSLRNKNKGEGMVRWERQNARFAAVRVGYVKIIPTNHGMARATGGDACHCGGAGMPCQVCNRTIGQEPPEMPPGYRTMIDTDGPKH